MNIRSIYATITLCAITAVSQAHAREYLVRFTGESPSQAQEFVARNAGTLDMVSKEGHLYKWTSEQALDVSWDANIVYVQPNYTYHIFQSPSLLRNRDALVKALRTVKDPSDGIQTKPDIQPPPIEASGADPLLQQAWGMFKVGADQAWKQTAQGKDIIVADTDTGIDYNHPDLISQVWHNKGEIPNNGIDDDKNGYIDDIIGWDFVLNDNRPFDLTKSLMEILLQGGNPGHGTHTAGVIGARLNNGVGTAGTAPQVKIMPCRFISDSGQGSTADAIKAIDYAINNGANIISASWGGEAAQDADDAALKEAIQRAQAKGVLFVAAAGNGRANAQGQPAGFDNDNDPKPMVPASFGLPNIIAVAAVDSNDKLASFSNWGNKTVQVAAPGVKILSTTPGGQYQDTIIDMGGIKATWDGTSMATPFVSGGLAVIWSQNKAQGWEAVKNTLLSNVDAVASLSGKIVTGGRLQLKKIGQ